MSIKVAIKRELNSAPRLKFISDAYQSVKPSKSSVGCAVCNPPLKSPNLNFTTHRHQQVVLCSQDVICINLHWSRFCFYGSKRSLRECPLLREMRAGGVNNETVRQQKYKTDFAIIVTIALLSAHKILQIRNASFCNERISARSFITYYYTK